MFICLIIVNVALCVLLSCRYVNYLQLASYKLSLSKKDIVHTTKIIMYSLVGAVLMLGLSFIKVNYVKYIAVYSFYIPLLVLVGIDMFKKRKTPLVVTSRVVRLFITLSILVGLSVFGLEVLTYYVGGASGSMEWIIYILLFLLVRFAFIINLPMENMIKAHYFNASTKKLKSRPDIIKIGITGSYGKTSVKNILAQMLAKKYNVVASPYSYNTPMGYAKTIGMIKEDTQVLIMEIGARHRGDVKKIADSLVPDIAIITGIAPCHLETFKSVEDIVLTKSEILDSMNSDGLAVFNGSNAQVRNMYEVCPIAKKELVKTNSGYAVVSDVVTTSSGSEFTLYIGENEAECKTKLIGEHNIQNILLAVTVASKLGLSIDEIACSIYELESTPHRLEVSQANGITIIDDSYNANPVGVSASLRALSLFKDRKVCLCQGMVELGESTFKENYELGIKLSSVCDLVMLTGSMSPIIKKGLLDSGYNPTKIIEYRSLDEAVKNFSEVLRANDVLLLMNDLPDNY